MSNAYRDQGEKKGLQRDIVGRKVQNRNPYRLEFGRFEINQTTGRPRGLFTLKGKRRKSEEKSNKKINNKANSIQDDLKNYVVTIGHDQKEHSEVTYAKAFHTLVVKRGKLPK